MPCLTHCCREETIPSSPQRMQQLQAPPRLPEHLQRPQQLPVPVPVVRGHPRRLPRLRKRRMPTPPAVAARRRPRRWARTPLTPRLRHRAKERSERSRTACPGHVSCILGYSVGAVCSARISTTTHLFICPTYGSRRLIYKCHDVAQCKEECSPPRRTAALALRHSAAQYSTVQDTRRIIISCLPGCSPLQPPAPVRPRRS